MKILSIKNLFKIKNLKFKIPVKVIVAFLIAVVGFGVYSYLNSKPAIAAWFDESWLYRQII